MSNDEFKISALNLKNELIDVILHECDHCHQPVPKVGTCINCGTEYKHCSTFENYETGFIHYLYECEGCPESSKKAQKVIKVVENSEKRQQDEDLIKSFF